MKIGITGHQHLEDSSAWPWVETCIREQLFLSESLVGISSLAIGVDQLFATLVLESKGQLIAVIPYPDYIESFDSDRDKIRYEGLKSQASEVEVLPANADIEESYLRAGYHVIDLCDTLVAVWNGQAAQGKGGTGDAVSYAMSEGKKVVHINPEKRSVSYL